MSAARRKGTEPIINVDADTPEFLKDEGEETTSERETLNTWQALCESGPLPRLSGDDDEEVSRLVLPWLSKTGS